MNDDIANALRLARRRMDVGGVPEGVPDEASQEAFLREQLAGSAPQYEPEAGMLTAKKAGLMAAGMAPGAGIASAVGEFPTAEGGKEPSMVEDWRKGEYLSAGLKGLGAAGDVAYATPVVGPVLGAAMKAPLAAKLAMAVAPMAKVAGEVAPLVETAPRVTNPIGMYSAAAEAARSLPQEKGSLQQMLATMKGVSPEEIQWSGVNEAFAGRPSVTREELAKHFEGRLPGVEEKVYLNEPIKGSGWESVEGGTKFSEHTIPGGENYREVVMHLPLQTSPKAKEAYDITKRMNEGEFNGLNDEERRDLFKKRDALLQEAKNEERLTFRSSHWNEPNVLAHLRMSDRVGPEGTKDLHLEELQSDWGQKGRKEGFKGELVKNYAVNWNEQPIISYDSMEEAQNHIQRALRNDPNAPVSISEIMGTRASGSSEEMSKVLRAPYVTSTAGWTDLGLKRALQEAVNGGYDRLLITPGAEQAARYDLSRQVNKIEVPMVNKDGSRSVRIDPIDGSSIKLMVNEKRVVDGYGSASSQFEGKTLDEVVGKEIADRIMSVEEPKVFEGEGLSVGGEGMKSFYDKIVPNQLNKILKKIDKDAKLKLHAHPIASGEYKVILPNGKIVHQTPHIESANAIAGQFPDAEVIQDQTVNTHVLEITPKMREAIKKGFAAYADGGEVTEKPTKNHDSMHLNAVSKRGMAISSSLERQKGGKVMDDVEKALSLSKNMMKKRNVSHETKKNNKNYEIKRGKYADGGEILTPQRTMTQQMSPEQFQMPEFGGIEFTPEEMEVLKSLPINNQEEDMSFIHDLDFSPEEMEVMKNLQPFVEGAQGEQERESGGKVNTIIDRDPDWKMGLASGGKTPTWQRKEGQNPEGGLNAKGRASYNRANPGKPGLKPPAPHPKTEKDANRRKSFCARMSGMPGPMKDDKGRPTRKALSLRAWNCADGGAIVGKSHILSPVYGMRYNPETNRMDSPESKDIGFYGPLRSGDHIVSEYSQGSGGVEYPTLYPGMSKQDIAQVLMAERLARGVPKNIDKSAYESARSRLSKGHSPFWEQGYDPYPTFSPDQSWTERAKGGLIWNKPRPKKLGEPKPLTPSQKASAKASAKAAGRPYPNMIDSINAAKKGRD